MKHAKRKWAVVCLLTLLLSGCRKNQDKTSPEAITLSRRAVVPCPNRPIINANLVPVGLLSLERSAIKSVTAGNKILFVGGNNSNPNTNPSLVVDIYDFVADTLIKTTLKENYPEGFAIASSGDKIFIAGGSKIDIYDASSDSWSESRLSVP